MINEVLIFYHFFSPNGMAQRQVNLRCQIISRTTYFSCHVEVRFRRMKTDAQF